MKRKTKRKNDSNSPKTPEIAKKKSSKEPKGTEVNPNASGSAGSSSQRRRSLSSLFKRSRDRQARAKSESSDRSQSRATSSGGVEVSENLGYNPRTEPRDHLRRMTVREALAESRTRGRSPNRRAIYNLEKRIMDGHGVLEDTSSVKSLSTSLPHIPDQIPTHDDEIVLLSNVSSEDLTLTRSGKRRGHSEGRHPHDDFITNTNSSRNNENFLPLDKRKYIINKDAASLISDTTSPTAISTREVHTAEVHSPHSSRDPSPYSATAFAHQERSRRESFAKFLQLRETLPRRSTSNLSISRQSVDSLVGSDDHQTLLNSLPVPEPRYVPLGNVSLLHDGTKVVLPTYDEAMASSSYPDGNKTLTTSPTSRFQQINRKLPQAGTKAKNTTKGSMNSKVQDESPRAVHNDRKSRSSYVSPRRFTGSRKSSSLKRSTDRNVPKEEVIKPDKTGSNLESVPKRYFRQFSSSSEKSKRKLSNQSDISQPELPKHEDNESSFKVIEYTDIPATVQDNELKNMINVKQDDNTFLKRPASLKKHAVTSDVFDHSESKEENAIGDTSELNTDLKRVADKIQDAMDSVNDKPKIEQFPNTEFTAVPLESITNDAPFKMLTDNKKERKNSEVKLDSKPKSSSLSKQLSSKSDSISNDIEDILMKDDVFETNIDDISLRSEGKVIDEAKDVDLSKNENQLQDIKPLSERESKNDSIEDNKIENVDTSKEKKGKPKKESKKKKKRKCKSESGENNIEEPVKEPEDLTGEKNIKSKKSKKDRKKSKKVRSMSTPGSETHEQRKPDAEKAIDNQLKNDIIVKADEIVEKEVKPKATKRKSFFRRKRSSDTRSPSIKRAIVKVGRAASLSNILGTPELSRAARKPSLIQTDSLKRSHSVEEISSLRYNKIEPLNLKIPDSIFNRRSAKNAIWNIQTEVPKAKERKSQPKLSLSAIISLRSKVGRFKKSKQAKDSAEAEAGGSPQVEESQSAAVEEAPVDTEQLNENSEARDRYMANIVYENELNSSLNKPRDSIVETALIEDELENETANIIHEKKIHFDSYLGDQHISEEELIKQRQRNTRLTDRRESKVRIRQKKVISCCKKLIAFLFSHIGLCSLVVAYCVAGGFIFKNLEGSNELEHKKEMQEVRMNYTNQIFSLAFQNQFTKRSAEEFKTQVNAKLKEYGSKIYRETKEAGWDGKDSASEPEQWSFPSSLLYAITVMTTIGYGHVAPKTNIGRIVTIGYAVLGIPLTLLCLTNIGDVMAKGFRILYGKVCCGLCCLLFRPSRRRVVHDPEKGLPACEERMVVQEEAKSEELIHVPTSVCLLLMSAYILLGTWAFCTWEDWDLVTGTYFCFITLSTIGFGDVVPGMTSDKWDMNEKLVLCALYLILGLSLIAMCFNLVQEDVKAKCKWLGMKLGIIDKPVSNV